MLLQFWKRIPTQKDDEWINSRLIDQNGVSIPRDFEKLGDVCYACSRKVDQNTLSAAIFRAHLLSTHPYISNNEEPPEHTIIIEASMTLSKTKQKMPPHFHEWVTGRLMDNDIRVGQSTKIDPVLCL